MMIGATTTMTTTMQEPQHRTAQDAFHQVMLGRMGSLVNASDEYLMELERRAHEWIGEMRAEMARRIEVSKNACENCAACESEPRESGSIYCSGCAADRSASP